MKPAAFGMPKHLGVLFNHATLGALCNLREITVKYGVPFKEEKFAEFIESYPKLEKISLIGRNIDLPNPSSAEIEKLANIREKGFRLNLNLANNENRCLH